MGPIDRRVLLDAIDRAVERFVSSVTEGSFEEADVWADAALALAARLDLHEVGHA